MNLLKEKYPEIFSQINIEKTLEKYPNLDIDNLTCGSGLKIFWNCPHSHLYSSAVHHRTKDNSGCPYCCNLKLWPGYNDLETFCNNTIEYKYLLDEWDTEKNNLKANEVLAGGTKKYYWNCPNGHIYEQIVENKIGKNYGCPFCFNGIDNLLITRRPDLFNQIDFEKTRKLYPDIDFTKIQLPSRRKIYWKCTQGHSFLQGISCRTKQNQGCPYCFNHASKIQLLIFLLIRRYFDSDSKINFLIGNNSKNNHPWEIDIYIPGIRTCLEYDGLFFHNTEKTLEREIRKNNYLKALNYNIIRIKETEDKNKLDKYFENIDGVDIYYINLETDKKYFNKLSEIFSSIFGIIIENLEEIYLKISNDKMKFIKKYEKYS